jgi:hypothetical protein
MSITSVEQTVAIDIVGYEVKLWVEEGIERRKRNTGIVIIIPKKIPIEQKISLCFFFRPIIPNIIARIGEIMASDIGWPSV